uniref:DUF6589 domain-containing protein n=1 Tax=Clytia hemisphaerica TaxID=252671 RepID=A0A7M5X9Y8_9CNID
MTVYCAESMNLPIMVLFTKSHLEPSSQVKYESNDDDDDDMCNYQTSFMQLAMVIYNFHDAISEGDGDRILRQWKFMLLFYKADDPHSSKYCVEAFYLLIQYYALLAPQTAERLIWNRFSKSVHGPGENIPLDMALEHFNKILKNGIRNMGPNNSSQKAVDRFCKALVIALNINKAILENFD